MTASATANRPVSRDVAARPTVAIIGAGVMGSGIAALALGHGCRVLLVEIDEKRSSVVRGDIELGLRTAALMNRFPDGVTAGVLEVHAGAEPDLIGRADVVIEAVVELPDVKREVLAAVEAAARPGTPLITNTSGIPVAELAGALTEPGCLVGVHFMNPAYLIDSVEVIRGAGTSEGTLQRALTVLRTLGRKPVVVGDGAGFVTSRLLHRMINDAVNVVADGRADAVSVDNLMQSCIGHRTGPLRTADLIGLDNLADSLRALHERTGDESFRPSPLLLDLIADGNLGRKSGRGFYDYEESA